MFHWLRLISISYHRDINTLNNGHIDQLKFNSNNIVCQTPIKRRKKAHIEKKKKKVRFVYNL